MLDVSGIESFDPSLPIRLQDHLNGSVSDLRRNSSYAFAHDPANSEKRFSLVFGYPDGINANGIVEGNAFYSNGRIFLYIPSMQGHLVKSTIFNIPGQVVYDRSATSNGTMVVEAPLIKGMYMVGVASEGRRFISKIIN